MRKFIIKASKQITLPVTPQSFEVSYGRRIETVNIHEVGDVNLPGGMALGSIKIGCMFPKNNYPFALDYGDPYAYVEAIQKAIRKKRAVRFVVSGTEINERVLLEDITYGERDGTGDVYATITMRGYRKVAAAQTAQVGAVVPVITPTVTTATMTGGSVVRELTTRDDDQETTMQSRVFTAGKTYYEICRIVYGDSRYATAVRLAEYNGDNWASLTLKTNRKIKTPPLSMLEGKTYRDQGDVE